MTRFLPLVLVALSALPAAAQPKAGGEAPDFPPGQFSDGRTYSLADLRGKAVVLFFYESQCPRCKGAIPERNDVVKAFEGKPVKFFAVAAGDPLASAVGYGRETSLQMPIFADSLGLMEARYGQKISLQNIWQFRVIGPDGKLVGYDMGKATIERALAGAAWKYDPADYDPKLRLALDAFETNNWEAGVKLLAPHRRSSTKPLAESANKLYDAVKKEADGVKAEAEAAAEGDPVKAYDLYAKVAAAFPTDAVGKEALAAKNKLAGTKALTAELAARKAYAPLAGTLANGSPGQKAQFAAQLQPFLKKHAGTPTAAKVADLVKELEK